MLKLSVEEISLLYHLAEALFKLHESSDNLLNLRYNNSGIIISTSTTATGIHSSIELPRNFFYSYDNDEDETIHTINLENFKKILYCFKNDDVDNLTEIEIDVLMQLKRISTKNGFEMSSALRPYVPNTIDTVENPSIIPLSIIKICPNFLISCFKQLSTINKSRDYAIVGNKAMTIEIIENTTESSTQKKKIYILSFSCKSENRLNKWDINKINESEGPLFSLQTDQNLSYSYQSKTLLNLTSNLNKFNSNFIELRISETCLIVDIPVK